jgi:hypothetical protein
MQDDDVLSVLGMYSGPVLGQGYDPYDSNANMTSGNIQADIIQAVTIYDSKGGTHLGNIALKKVEDGFLNLGFAKSSIVGSLPKRPIEVSNTITNKSTTGPAIAIQTHFTYLFAENRTFGIFEVMDQIDSAIWRLAKKWDKEHLDILSDMPVVMYASQPNVRLDPCRKAVQDPDLVDKKITGEYIFSLANIMNPIHAKQNLSLNPNSMA